MVQRIQSVYLLLIAGLMLAMLFVPLSSFTGVDGRLFLFKILSITDQQTLQILIATWPVVIPVAAVIINSLFTIFLYKNRKLQVKLAGANMPLVLVFYCAFIYYAWDFMKSYPSTIQIGFALALPIVALIVNMLAVRAINKDEKLIKSLDRIR